MVPSAISRISSKDDSSMYKHVFLLVEVSYAVAAAAATAAAFGITVLKRRRSRQFYCYVNFI